MFDAIREHDQRMEFAGNAFFAAISRLSQSAIAAVTAAMFANATIAAIAPAIGNRDAAARAN